MRLVGRALLLAAIIGSGQAVTPAFAETGTTPVAAVQSQAGFEQLTDLVVRRINRAQIDASKVVQRGLLAHWAQHPESAPTSGPDLDAVRKQLDRLHRQALRVATEGVC